VATAPPISKSAFSTGLAREGTPKVQVVVGTVVGVVVGEVVGDVVGVEVGVVVTPTVVVVSAIVVVVSSGSPSIWTVTTTLAGVPQPSPDDP
jgi:hypothetical protein